MTQKQEITAAVDGFWSALHRAAVAIGGQHPLEAHGELERCREALINLYRLALAPGNGQVGWEGADALPGAQALKSLHEWLVCPLQTRLQWHCACKLAAAYESMVLPLMERMGEPYPWAMRNRTFERLEQVRPDRGAQAIPALPIAKEEPPEPTGPVRIRIKRRRPAP
jgi:hypothetical protein